MTPVSFPAADGTAIPGYLTLPPGSDGKGLPAIVLPHGGPSARDEWGFDWLVQFFVARGYAVLQPNFRGSSGYGSAWFGRNGFQAWRTAIGDVNDAGRWLVGAGHRRSRQAGDRRLVLRRLCRAAVAGARPRRCIKAVVAIAPVTDLEQLREDSRALHQLPRWSTDSSARASMSRKAARRATPSASPRRSCCSTARATRTSRSRSRA